MRISIIFALVLSALAGCNRNNQPTMHQARTQNTPTEQAAQAEDLDTENPNNRTLPDSTEQNPNNQQQPGSSDVGTPNDASGSNPTSPTDDVDDDLPPNTGPDVP